MIMGKRENMSNTENNVSEPKTGKRSPFAGFTKKNILSIIVLSLAASFTVFFFTPLDIFLGNQREFVVSFKHIAVPMLLTSLAAAAAVAVLMLLLLLIKESHFYRFYMKEKFSLIHLKFFVRNC